MDTEPTQTELVAARIAQVINTAMTTRLGVIPVGKAYRDMCAEIRHLYEDTFTPMSYEVICDNTNNSQEDIDLGRVVVDVRPRAPITFKATLGPNGVFINKV